MEFINEDGSGAPVILIVDDNPQNLQVLGKRLQEAKYEVEFAMDGQAALEWIENKSFDLILLDINMPGMSGFDVCRQIRSMERLKNMPIIFLSAETDRESILKGFELRAQDYITKPFDSRELIARVNTHLLLKRNREKLENLNRTLEQKVEERTRQLKELNEQLEETNHKLFDLDRAKADFLNLISHEIRTPLNGIIGPVELLKGPIYANQLGDLIEMLDQSVKRLEKFALDALLITRLKMMRNLTNKLQITFHRLISESIDDFRDIIQKKNIVVNTSLDENTNKIYGNPEFVRKAVSNMLENALKHTPVNGAVSIMTRIDNNNVVCEIIDQGPGFKSAPEILLKEFFTHADKYSDTSKGIGLPVTKMIMNLHGGELLIQNHPSGGASVKLAFPF